MMKAFFSNGEAPMYQKSIDLLNQAVADELTAVHQYMYFHFHCDDQGIELLSALFKRTAIEEMLHVERLADRILFLKGDVVMEANAKVEPITDVMAMLEWADQSEMAAIRMYNDFAMQCGAAADSASKKVFEDLVMDEERHYGQFDNESDNVKRFGISYLAQQAMERSKASAAVPGNN
jgi:bacterioferritin